MNKEIQSKVNTQVFEQKPVDFDAKIDVTAAYVEVEGRVLLLQLSESKKEAKSWGVPAGKLEGEETPEEGVRRELFEETGIILEAPTQVHTLGRLYMRNPDLDYVYHVFGIHLPEAPKILLSSEHTDYRWILLNEWKDFKLMGGGEEALNFYINRLKKKRSGAHVDIYSERG